MSPTNKADTSPWDKLPSLRQQGSNIDNDIKRLTDRVVSISKETAESLDCNGKILESYFRQLSQLQTRIEEFDFYQEGRTAGEILFVA